MLTCQRFQVLYCALHLVEGAVTVASAIPSLPLSPWIISTFVLGDHSELSASRIRVTPVFLVGWLLTVVSGIIRLSCYRALGRLFTFELTIRKEHKLITSGPYSIVRHPSYTGIIMNIVGYNLCHLSKGSWLWECSGLWSSGVVGPVLMFAWLVSRVCLMLVFVERTRTEDDMLRKEFSDWNEWARKVPYKLIPFVY